MHKQQGFSLIELAIVLVIAGLLMAGVLRGQEWIANAKVKSLAADFRNVPTYFMGYQDRFRALPGDDHAANAHVSGTNASDTQTQNGLLQGNWNSTTTTDESYLVWQHLRLAGLMNGSTDTSADAQTNYLPRNGEGGRIGVVATTSAASPVTGSLTGAHLICSDAILGRYASQLDSMLDDGSGASGAMRIVVSGSPSAGITTVDAGSSYLVCMNF